MFFGRPLLRERPWQHELGLKQRTACLTTIRRAELTEGQTSLTTANDLAIRRALESAGIEFIDENGGGPGVRLRGRETRDVDDRGPHCREPSFVLGHSPLRV
jgi:hypothetical protein